MKTKSTHSKFHLIILVFSVILCFTVTRSIAQVTSSALTGKVTDEKGEPVPGAVVLATHTPTGTKYPTLTDLNGKFNIINMNVGGPYSIDVSYVSYMSQNMQNVMLSLGETQRIDFKLKEKSTELEEVVISADQDANKSGAGTRVGREQIQNLPSISRSITDFSKLTPQSSNNSFAGSNFRYNNVTLDGAVNNDAIGFSPSLGGVSGTSNMPGSSTRTNPISLDAVQDMQVSISPYDVKLGNFTGGSVNAVTRRGTNEVEASLYAYGRNATITGLDNSGDKSKMPSNYLDYQTGFRVGLPIIKNKLFFFTNVEITDREEPIFYGAGQSGSFMSTALAGQITDSLKSKHFMPTSQFNPTGTYDPGATGAYSIYSKSTKFFGRLDWNINSKNQLTLRNNYIVSSATNLERSATQFQFGNYDFTQHNNNISTVAELKTRINNNLSNNLIGGFTNIHDYRDPTGSIFPQIQINNVNGSGTILLGTNREAGVFNMNQRTFELTDNLTWFKGKHAFTAGTHNEFYQIQYGFINSWNGRIDYNNTTDFFNNKPIRIRATYNLGDDTRNGNYNTPSAKFNIALLSAYLQDEYSILDNLKITPGIRVDMAVVPQGPTMSPLTQNSPNDPNYGTTYTHTQLNQLDNKIFGQPMVSPRIGFNYDVLKNKKFVVRGGTGLFTGRIPFAWLGYAYYNNGVNYGSFDLNKNNKIYNIPTDPTQFANLNTSVFKQPNRVEVDMVDKNFHMPQVWRSNLAFDIILPGDYKLTLEGIYTKTIYDVKFQQVNLKDSVKYYPYDVNHQQPVYLSGGPNGSRVNSNFSNAYLISNTTQGYRYSLTAQIKKQYKFGLNFMAAYTYGQAHDISNGIRNSPESNWQLNQALSPNNPQLAYSNFDIRNRIVATVGYKKTWNKRFTTNVALIYTGQSGSPYTWVNGSNKASASGQQQDLAYIPKNTSDLNIAANYTDPSTGIVYTTAQQQAALDAYINNDKYLSSRRGQFTERNAARTPWNNSLDIRMMQDINFYVKEKKQTLQITFDIMNLTNLINSKWGYQYFVPNTFNSSANTGLIVASTPANSNPTYNFLTPTTTPYSIDKLASRWQGQLGLRYSF